MGYSDEAIQLRKIATVKLPRLVDRLSFLHIDKAKVVQGRTGVIGLLENGSEVQIPGGSLCVLMLGPGVSITTPALRTLSNSGCVVIVSSAAGDGCYSTAVPLSSSGKWGCAQAILWANLDYRTKAARFLYSQRFGDVLDDDVTIAQMRGFEGQRMKHVYKEQAAAIGIDFWRRKVEDEPGTVNANLNLANNILYGVAACVCSALGLNPALGIIHQGASSAFLFDLADCFKASVSIPAAFKAHDDSNSSATTLRLVRGAIRRQRVLKQMMEITLEMLEPYLASTGGEDVLFGDASVVPGHTNYAKEVDSGDSEILEDYFDSTDEEPF